MAYRDFLKSRKVDLAGARKIGLRDGLKNRHVGSQAFFKLRTAAEINIWLEGWREGQATLKHQHATAAAAG